MVLQKTPVKEEFVMQAFRLAGEQLDGVLLVRRPRGAPSPPDFTLWFPNCPPCQKSAWQVNKKMAARVHALLVDIDCKLKNSSTQETFVRRPLV